jgi:hypothetical protein
MIDNKVDLPSITRHRKSSHHEPWLDGFPSARFAPFGNPELFFFVFLVFLVFFVYFV